MNTDKTALIKFSQEFMSPFGTKMWVGFESPVDLTGDMDLTFQFQKTMQIVRNWGELACQTDYQNNGNYQGPIASGTIPLPEIKIEKNTLSVMDNIDLIMSSPTLDDLKTYQFVASQNIHLLEAYNKRHQELSK